MAIVTFMSDYGVKDHYVASVKAAILRENQNITILDISHDISPFDIGHAAYVLKHIFRDFVPGSVHLCAVDMSNKAPNRLVAIKLEDHYFLGFDNGIFSLLSDQIPQAMVEIDPQKSSSAFPVKDVLAPAAAALVSGVKLEQVGTPIAEIQRLYSRQLKVTKKEIAGNVIRVDNYGNLITNITASEFDTILRINKQPSFEVVFGRERAATLHVHYDEVESGECFLIFNSMGLLQIGINKGNAAELLGLKLDTPVNIYFSA